MRRPHHPSCGGGEIFEWIRLVKFYCVDEPRKMDLTILIRTKKLFRQVFLSFPVSFVHQVHQSE